MHLLQSYLRLQVAAAVQLSMLCLMLLGVQQAGDLLTMVQEWEAHCLWGPGSVRGPIRP